MNHSASPLSEVVSTALATTNLSDRQIESLTGISRATLKRKLADNGKFTIAEIERIAELIGIRTSQLIARSEDAA